MRRDLGDFQTPPELIDSIVRVLADGRQWPRVLEPTCGTGGFIAGVLRAAHAPVEVWGIELQADHLRTARAKVRDAKQTRVHLRKANIFELDLNRDIRWDSSGPLLIVGNPPWVTNAELSSLGSTNLPVKENFKKLRGLDAMTGGSNFDIAEYIWLKLIRELAPQRPTIALLCKTTVARNVLHYAHDAALPIANATIRRIDAKQFFGAAVDACLFTLDVGVAQPSYDARVYASLEATEPLSTMGVVGGRLVSELGKYRRSAFADGDSPEEWRQGIKHDASSVMELLPLGHDFENKLGESVDVERHHVYPLLKSSDLNAGGFPRFSVLVTQQTLADDTQLLEERSPKLWSYLTRHRLILDGRKSSIYRQRGPFSMFGIGEYSFAPYKVAVSGMYKRSSFRFVAPIDGRPVMLDDTCYFLPFHSGEEAAIVTATLNHTLSRDLIESLVFWDSKRPVTKALLKRLNLEALLSQAPRTSILADARQLFSSGRVSRDRPRWAEVVEKLLTRWRSGGQPDQLLLLDNARPAYLTEKLIP